MRYLYFSYWKINFMVVVLEKLYRDKEKHFKNILKLLYF